VATYDAKEALYPDKEALYRAKEALCGARLKKNSHFLVEWRFFL
jgi:hypothetical protein